MEVAIVTGASKGLGTSARRGARRTWLVTRHRCQRSRALSGAEEDLRSELAVGADR